MSEDLHDLIVYAVGVVTGVCLATRAHNNQTIHVGLIDHDGIGVGREGQR